MVALEVQLNLFIPIVRACVTLGHAQWMEEKLVYRKLA